MIEADKEIDQPAGFFLLDIGAAAAGLVLAESDDFHLLQFFCHSLPLCRIVVGPAKAEMGK